METHGIYIPTASVLRDVRANVRDARHDMSVTTRRLISMAHVSDWLAR